MRCETGSPNLGPKEPLNTQIQDLEDQKKAFTIATYEIKGRKLAIFHDTVAEPVPDFSHTVGPNLQPIPELKSIKFKYVPKNIFIDLRDCHVVFLDPLKAEGDIFIQCITAVVFNFIHSEKGEVKIKPKDRLICLGGKIWDSGSSASKIELEWRHHCAFFKGLYVDIFNAFRKGVAEKSVKKIEDACVKARIFL